MGEEQEYQIKQIVWAKVQNYSVWPAKIVRKLMQHGKTVYKINFFGDPSYCYLHSQSLISFQSLNSQQLNSGSDLKLKRSIQLANIAYSKQYQIICCKNTQPDHIIYQEQVPKCIIEQSEIFEKQEIEIVQEFKQFEQKITDNYIANQFNNIVLTPQNVLQSLELYLINKKRFFIKNLKRKQIISFQNDLKQNLLLKYNLNTIHLLKQSQKSIQNIRPIFLKQKKINKKINKKHKFQTEQLICRKIQKILLQKRIPLDYSMNLTIKIVKKIEKGRYNFNHGYDSLQFKQNFMKVMCQISQNLKQFDSESQSLYFLQSQIMSLIQMQINQSKIDQFSKGTHISEANVV